MSFSVLNDIFKQGIEVANLNINGRIIHNFGYAAGAILLKESDQKLPEIMLTSNVKGKATKNITVNREIKKQVTSFY